MWLYGVIYMYMGVGVSVHSKTCEKCMEKALYEPEVAHPPTLGAICEVPPIVSPVYMYSTKVPTKVS